MTTSSPPSGGDVPGGFLHQAGLHRVRQLARHDLAVDGVGEAYRVVLGDQPQVAHVFEVAGRKGGLVAAGQNRLDDAPHAVFLQLVGQLIQVRFAAEDECLLGVVNIVPSDWPAAVGARSCFQNRLRRPGH